MLIKKRINLSILTALFFILGICSPVGAWVAGYNYLKTLTVTGSTEGAVTNHTQEVIVGWGSDPIETGSWTINSVSYNYRIAITITESTNATITNYKCLLPINMKFLDDNSYLHASFDGDEVEFDWDGDTGGLDYWAENSIKTLSRGKYFVEITMTARQSKTLYFYFDPDISATSSNFENWTHQTQYFTPSASADDWSDWGTFSNSGDNIGIGQYATLVFNCGVRFPSVTVPQYAIIDSASFLVTEDGNSDSGDTYTKIYAEDVPNSDQVADHADYLSLDLTDASVDWDITGAWTQDVEYESEDIKTVIQEMVDKANWASGNAIQIIWKDDGSANNDWRNAYSVDDGVGDVCRLKITADIITPGVDYTDYPLVNVPILQKVDVFLDGHSENWPYDLIFTNDSDTTLYHVPVPEGEQNKNNKAIPFLVGTFNVSQSPATYTIRCYYGNASQTTAPASWSGPDACAVYYDFEDTVGDFTPVNGGWSGQTQQKPIFKGGPQGFGQAFLVAKSGSTYNVLVGCEGQDWNDWFSNSIRWKQPLVSSRYSSTDMRHFKNHGPVFKDLETSIDTVDNIQPWQAVVHYCLHDGVYWLVYFNYTDEGGGDSELCMASTTDWQTYTISPNNPIIAQGYDGSPDYTFGGGCLVRDYADENWYLYASYIEAGNATIHAFVSTDDGDPDDATYDYDTGGEVVDFADSGSSYIESVWVEKVNSTKYVLFGGDIENEPPITQRVCYTAESENPLSFTPVGRVTNQEYEFDKIASGYPSFYTDGSDLYQTYYGQPETAAGLLGGTTADNFIGLSVDVGGDHSAWTCQNTAKMIYCEDADTRDETVDDGGYSNMLFYAPILLKYGQNEAGILVRYQDATNYYYCNLSRAGMEVELHEYIATVDAEIAADYEFDWSMEESGTPYLLKIGCYKDGSNDNHLHGWISRSGAEWNEAFDVVDNSLTDATWGVGYIGLGSTFFSDTFIGVNWIDPPPTLSAGVEVSSVKQPPIINILDY